MANNEDVYIEKNGKIVLFTEQYSNKLDASASEIITINPLTQVNRAIVQTAPAETVSGHCYATVVSGGCSGNAVKVLWLATSGHSFTWASGAMTSGQRVDILAGGH